MSADKSQDIHPHTRDILAEIEAEVAHELEEERPPQGGPVYQTVGAVVGIAIGVVGAVLSYGYGLGSFNQPGGGLWPFIVSVVIAHFAADSGPSTTHVGIVDSAQNSETTRLAALGDAVGTDIQITDYTDDASARAAVDTRWAISTRVRADQAEASAEPTRASVAVSRLDSASSRTTTAGSWTNARAIPRRWTSPPERGASLRGVP